MTFRNDFAIWVKDFQERVTNSFEDIDGASQFEIQPWTKPEGEMLQGHGEMRVMRGKVFEKVGVNFSHVHGTFSEKFREKIPGAMENDGKFWACGVSLVAHTANPKVPAVHMNLRRIETSTGWFGGGADLTPYFPYAEDTKLFHDALKAPCDIYGAGTYDTYKKAADEYFYLPHRDEPRGVGGTFIEGLSGDDLMKDWALIQGTGEGFFKAYTEIVKRRKDEPFTEADREHQLIRRGRYVEFNLLHDRGTKFGFETGGNTEAILMSMPPIVKWP